MGFTRTTLIKETHRKNADIAAGNAKLSKRKDCNDTCDRTLDESIVAFDILHQGYDLESWLSVRASQLQAATIMITDDGFEYFSLLNTEFQQNYLLLLESLSNDIVEALEMMERAREIERKKKAA